MREGKILQGADLPKSKTKIIGRHISDLYARILTEGEVRDTTGPRK